MPQVLKSSTPLPVLFVEDGKAVLRFSKIFGFHEPLRKGGRRNQRPSIPRGKLSTDWESFARTLFVELTR